MTDTSKFVKDDNLVNDGHSHTFIPVLYGKPSQKAIDEASAGKWYLAGCAPTPINEVCSICGLGRIEKR